MCYRCLRWGGEGSLLRICTRYYVSDVFFFVFPIWFIIFEVSLKIICMKYTNDVYSTMFVLSYRHKLEEVSFYNNN